MHKITASQLAAPPPNIDPNRERRGDGGGRTLLPRVCVRFPSTHPHIRLSHSCIRVAIVLTAPLSRRRARAGIKNEQRGDERSRDALPAPERQCLSLSLSLPPSPSLSLKRLLPRSLRPHHLLPPGIIPFLNLSRRNGRLRQRATMLVPVSPASRGGG